MPTNKTAPTLSKLAFDKVCRQLEKAITGEKSSSSFVCGGIIPISDATASTTNPGPSTAKTSPPINLFWKKEGDGMQAYNVMLPHGDTESTPSIGVDGLRQLVSDCEPAGFGKGQEAVMDPQYRKAGKLDPSQFASTFHPADFNILENIENVLVPRLNTVNEDILPSGRVEGELYKLNVYSGPSGLFQKHVDTPRSNSQIGSLVVCLPSSFDGGNLIVRHEGREVDFNWQVESANTIQWAAFYCDCEHEIRTITRGDRITLTYNLYIVEDPIRPNSLGSLDPTVFPLYEDIRTILLMPGFLKTGGVLGVFCSHAYAHTSKNASELLPRSLKGSDLVLYTVLKSLGIDTNVLPVLIDDYEYDDYQLSDGSSDEDSYYVYKDVGKGLHVGDTLTTTFNADNYYEDPLNKVIEKFWKQRDFKKPITWLCTPAHGQPAMSYLAYGNDPSCEVVYSYAAILAVIPPWTRRQSKIEKAEE